MGALRGCACAYWRVICCSFCGGNPYTMGFKLKLNLGQQHSFRRPDMCFASSGGIQYAFIPLHTNVGYNSTGAPVYGPGRLNNNSLCE